MIGTLLQRMGNWVSTEGPEADVFFASFCRLSRNLSDFAFPDKCSDEELSAVEERVLAAIETLDIQGQYYPLHKLDPLETQFLIERRVIGGEMLDASGARGVFLTQDGAVAFAINGVNHLTIRGYAAGQQLNEISARVAVFDDELAGGLNYAFTSRRGFLTPDLRDVGTGLHIGAILHLPSLEASGALPEHIGYTESRRHSIVPLIADGKKALGDFFVVSNSSTLGRSEEETLFHLRHIAGELAEHERAERTARLNEARLQVEDRIWRALGVARNARLLAFAEGLRVLSSLRLGLANGLLDQFTYPNISDTFVASQDAHLSLKLGRSTDELTLNASRADLFRTRFA